MADTPILGITELASNQVNQFATANEAFRALESATNDFLEVALGAGNATVAASDFRTYFMFRATGNAVARDLLFPAGKRFFLVHNAGSATLNVKLGTTTLTLDAGLAAFYYADGTSNGLIKIG